MVDYMLVPGYYEKEVILSNEALEILSKYKTVALFASVQFIHLDTVQTQLNAKGISVIFTHGKRTSGKFQLLGCDCFSGSYEDKSIFEKSDAILYIGDGLFHPRALLLAQRESESQKFCILFDPIAETVKTMSLKEIEKDRMKYKANLMKYLDATDIGILVSTKPGQQYMRNAIDLKKKSSKNAYIFLADTFDYHEMENFPFIQVWVNTACPRIGFDDARNMPKPLININDAQNPKEALQSCN